MGLLAEKDREYLKNEFQALGRPVKLVVFTQERECQYCRETRELSEELAELSAQIAVDVVTFDPDGDAARQYNIDKIPAIALIADGPEPVDYGIRFYGIPSGYEFSTLIEGIMMVAAGDSGLPAELKKQVAAIDKPVHMQVFITPTCPYCPQAVHLAHQLAMENPNVKADMVEAIEFPHLSNKYNVMGVPRTVINETYHLEGAAPGAMVLDKIAEALA
ncbi:MAG TPA: thioredoxin family protein [Caldilineaceae bacterium]|nr:thioredoxin family protein [Caldilineaceae bacterium]